jgi:hypothetical protein
MEKGQNFIHGRMNFQKALWWGGGGGKKKKLCRVFKRAVG